MNSIHYFALVYNIPANGGFYLSFLYDKIIMHTFGLVSRKHKIYGESIWKIYNVLVLTMHTFT